MNIKYELEYGILIPNWHAFRLIQKVRFIPEPSNDSGTFCVIAFKLLSSLAP